MLTSDVRLRDVTEDDLPIFFDHQGDAVAIRMAAFPARDREAFLEHWTTKVLGDDSVTKRTILFDDQVVGNIVSFEMSGETLVGYWIGRDHWGKGIASRALSLS
jgi:RimJ/RimL family protein N-acetyltransferase